MDTGRITPKAWVGCLACYSAGRLVGEWVDAHEASGFIPCTRVEYGAPHEEWWVMDHEGLYIRGECSPMDAEARAMELDAVPDDIPHEAIKAYLANSDEESLSGLEEAYVGEYDSLGDFAQDWLAETTSADVWELLTSGIVSINWNHTAEEWPFDYLSVNGRLFVFRA